MAVFDAKCEIHKIPNLPEGVTIVAFDAEFSELITYLVEYIEDQSNEQ